MDVWCLKQQETSGNKRRKWRQNECRTVTATRMSLLDQQLTSECDKSVSESNFQQPKIYTTPHNPSWAAAFFLVIKNKNKMFLPNFKGTVWYFGRYTYMLSCQDLGEKIDTTVNREAESSSPLA